MTNPAMVFSKNRIAFNKMLSFLLDENARVNYPRRICFETLASIFRAPWCG